MIWIVSADIDEDVVERRARLRYIKEVSGDRYISWERKLGIVPGTGKLFVYYQCVTKDDINGTFITAHDYIVAVLCTKAYVAESEFVVANTCNVKKDFDKKILQLMQRINVSAQLYYAKQEKEIIQGLEYDSNIIRDVGSFGFKTSKSERILYRNQKMGLMEAIKRSFDYITA